MDEELDIEGSESDENAPIIKPDTFISDMQDPDWFNSAHSELHEDMDQASRNLIESMLAEEQFYYGEPVIDAEVKLELAIEGQTTITQSKPNKWTGADIDLLLSKIKEFGFGKWELIASQMGNRTSRQIQYKVRKLLSEGVLIPGAPEPKISVVSESKVSDLPKREILTSSASKKVEDNDEDEEIDIENSDESDHEKLKPVFLQHEIESNTSAESDIPSEAAEITSSSSDDEFKPVKDRQQVGELQPRREIDVKLSIKSEVSNSTTQPLPENDIDDISNEYIITLTSVAAFEKEFCPEWFLNHTGKQINKTPQRYMKIRNHILQMWEEIKPKYLSKSRIRPGLKGEGDVNAISRVHTFLESLGAINLNVAGGKKNSRYSEHHVYSEKIVHNSKWEDTGNEGRRRRKIRTANGEWMYELEGQTIEHVDPDVLSARKMLKKNAKYFADEELEKYNIKKPRKREVSDALGGYNPFKLISLRKYDDENPSPFKVNILSNTLIIMDFHSHLATTEIIGLLGGQYNDSTRLLEISDVFPCNSISTGVQCEMDPVSEMNARDHFQAKGLIVVGWYHSHPTFEPNPSIRDIENQANYQALFKRHDSIEPFIGIIVSPFDTKTPVPLSRFQFWYISEEFNSLGEYRLPYSCDKQIIPSSKLTPILYKQLSDLLGTYHDHPSKVNLMDIFRTRFTEMTKLEKMVASLEVHISLNASNGVSFLQQLRTLLMKWADIK